MIQNSIIDEQIHEPFLRYLCVTFKYTLQLKIFSVYIFPILYIYERICHSILLLNNEKYHFKYIKINKQDQSGIKYFKEFF